MTYLDKLLALRREKSTRVTSPQNLQKPPEDPFEGFEGDQPMAFLKYEGTSSAPDAGTTTARSASKFPERHCSECGQVGAEDDPLNEAGDGSPYLWHRACLDLRRRAAGAAGAPSYDPRARSAVRAIACWHCGKLTYRPQYLAWGKDLIPLHDRCTGAWVDAWDAMLCGGNAPRRPVRVALG